MITNPKKLYWLSMIADYNIRRRQPRAIQQGRKSVKNAAKHVGKWIKGGRIVHDVPIERHFKQRS